MSKETVRVNALELSDKVLEALHLARFAGLLVGHGEVDSLADGGAQLIRTFGREMAAPHLKKDFVLSVEEAEFMDSVVAQVLADIDKYRASFQEAVAATKKFNFR